MSDHILVLVGINPKYAVSEIIRDVKVCSSKWCKDNLLNGQNFSWQEGFGSFTVSVSQEIKVRTYILNQEKHHLKQNLLYYLMFMKLNLRKSFCGVNL